MGSKAAFAVVAAAAVAAAAAWWWLGQAGGIDPGNPRQVARGEQLYRQHCASCHGARLEGQPNWQVRKPTGELPAPPHDATGHTWHHADDQLFGIIKYGMARFAPPDYKSDMPAFAGTLSDEDIRAVLAFIKANWPAEVRDRQAAANRR